MSITAQQNTFYSHQFQTLTDKLHERLSPRSQGFTDLWDRSYELSHEEMVSMSLLEVLADKYQEMDSETRENLILMYIETQLCND